jgi:hypothetical protein
MNYTGIFDDLNYIQHASDLKNFNRWRAGWTIKLEFMDYVIKGMKSFLKSPFKS